MISHHLGHLHNVRADWAKVNEKASGAVPSCSALASDLRLSIARDDACASLAAAGGGRGHLRGRSGAATSADARPLYEPGARAAVFATQRRFSTAWARHLLDLALLLRRRSATNCSRSWSCARTTPWWRFPPVWPPRGDAYWRATTDGDWVIIGALNYGAVLRTLTDGGRYLLVECTALRRAMPFPPTCPRRRACRRVCPSPAR